MNNIDKLNKNLDELNSNFTLWKDLGLNEELLIIFISNKTKMSKKHVKDMLHYQKEFFEKLVNKEIAEAI